MENQLRRFLSNVMITSAVISLMKIDEARFDEESSSAIKHKTNFMYMQAAHNPNGPIIGS